MFGNMSNIEQSIEIVRRVHSKLGTSKLAQAAGVPYTTVHDCQKRQFNSPAISTLIKLADAAAAIEADEARAA